MHWLWYTLPLSYFPGLERLLGGAVPPICGGLEARRPLAVAAHPDDLEYFCGGTLALLAGAGASVIGVLATRGERGGDRRIREREQQEAGALLGYSALHHWDFPDRRVRADDPELRQRLSRVLEAVQPDLLLTFDVEHPFPIYRHNDHMAVGRAALELWQGPALLFHTRRPNLAVDISRVFQTKVRAFSAHRSQLPRHGLERLVAWHLGRPYVSSGRRYLEVYRSRV